MSSAGEKAIEGVCSPKGGHWRGVEMVSTVTTEMLTRAGEVMSAGETDWRCPAGRPASHSRLFFPGGSEGALARRRTRRTVDRSDLPLEVTIET